MTPQEMSIYAELVTQLCDSIDRLTEAVKEVRDHLHILQECAKPLRHLHVLTEAVDYIAHHVKS